MEKTDPDQPDVKQFQPLAIMGIFWMGFGVIVLFSSFFVRETPRVPLVRGLMTNVIAGVLLLGAGLFSWTKARKRAHRKLSAGDDG